MASMDDTSAGNMRKSIIDTLPAELLVNIIGYVAAYPPTLCSLARTCRLFQVECEKHIYKTIKLTLLEDLAPLIDNFSRLPERFAYVETLLVMYRILTSEMDGGNLSSFERELFNSYIGKMKSLKEWYIESPFDNFDWGTEAGREWVEKDMKQFQRALAAASWAKSDISDVQQSFDLRQGGLVRQHDVGLSKLEKLTIHSHGTSSDFWELEGFKCIFHHPSLRYIHISCVALPADLPELESFARLTPLTTLIFDECEIEPTSLRQILKTPKGLKSLTLGENNFNISINRPLCPRLTKSPDASLAALREVSHSLEELTHRDPTWRFPETLQPKYFVRGEGMRDFHHLRFMDVNPCSFLHQIVCSNGSAPPNLETLRLHHAYAGDIDESSKTAFDMYPKFEPYTFLSKLKTVESVIAACSESEFSLPQFICEETRLRKRHQYAYKLHAYGINYKVYLEATWSIGHIHPFLHDEPKPALVCVYDGAAVGFRRRIFDAGNVEASTSPGSADPPQVESNAAAELSLTDQLNQTDIRAIWNDLKCRLDRVWSDMAEVAEMSDGSGIRFLIDWDDEQDEEDAEEDDDNADADADWQDDEMMAFGD